MSRTPLLLTVLSGSLVYLLQAQQPPVKQPPADLTQTNDLTNFTVTLQQVIAPVLVYDKRHNYVNGLQPDQFRLYDNDKEQRLTSVDVTYTPISMVVAVQANVEADKILPQVNRVGSMLKPIILGDQGEAAVIAYDSRVRLLQPFTNDSDDITKAIKGIHAGSTSSRLIDAVDESVYLLQHKPKQRRRILLVIGEGRDGGSQAHARETLENLQLANVAVYFVDMSHLIGKLTTPPPDPRPAAQPPAAMGPLGGGHPSTPTTDDQAFGTDGYSADAIPLMLEIFRDVRNVFRVAPSTLFTKGTGGEQFPFATSRGLEQAISAIGDELHSQYLITYTPNNTGDGGFHKIDVEVVGRQYKCETKPGYFMAPIFH
ncbi:MAG TPA: VWA domain-containing protein [Bryobacteraceae bacterium]|nr:VWA domain-containing protein [Bryobacteraceae bacterium]